MDKPIVGHDQLEIIKRTLTGNNDFGIYIVNDNMPEWLCDIPRSKDESILFANVLKFDDWEVPILITDSGLYRYGKQIFEWTFVEQVTACDPDINDEWYWNYCFKLKGSIDWKLNFSHFESFKGSGGKTGFLAIGSFLDSLAKQNPYLDERVERKYGHTALEYFKQHLNYFASQTSINDIYPSFDANRKAMDYEPREQPIWNCLFYRNENRCDGLIVTNYGLWYGADKNKSYSFSWDSVAQVNYDDIEKTIVFYSKNRSRIDIPLSAFNGKFFAKGKKAERGRKLEEIFSGLIQCIKIEHNTLTPLKWIIADYGPSATDIIDFPTRCHQCGSYDFEIVKENHHNLEKVIGVVFDIAVKSFTGRTTHAGDISRPSDYKFHCLKCQNTWEEQIN